MTTVSGNVETPTASPGDPDAPRGSSEAGAFVIFSPVQNSRLERELTGRGWQVWVAGTLAGDIAALLDRVTNFLAEPGSPDRAVLLGHGVVTPAVVEFADRHPERATAVIVVDPPPDLALHARIQDLSCPILTVPTVDPGLVLRFLAGLEPQLAQPRLRPAPPPLLTPVLLNDPDVMRGFREMGPAHRINAPGVATTWILTGHHATTRVLADSRLVSDVELTAGFRLQPAGVKHRGEQDLVTIEGEEHARLRRLVGRYLTPARVETLRPRIQRETDALLDALATDEPVDLLREVALPLPVIVLCELFGFPARDRGYIHEWLVERMRQIPPDAHTDIDDYLYAGIADRRREATDDLLGWVVEAEQDQLSETDLVSAARLLMVAGHRAPTTLLANGLAALLRHREQWQRLVADPGLVAPAVEELFRFVTPFPVGLARHTTAPIDIDGKRIPENDLINASLVAANRDPAIFTDPDDLDVSREPNPHLAFGHGHHFCLGAALARTQAQIAIGALARRFPDMELVDDGRSLQYRESRVRYLFELPVVLQPPRG